MHTHRQTIKGKSVVCIGVLIFCKAIVALRNKKLRLTQSISALTPQLLFSEPKTQL
jgi:hypothetical protein